MRRLSARGDLGLARDTARLTAGRRRGKREDGRVLGTRSRSSGARGSLSRIFVSSRYSIIVVNCSSMFVVVIDVSFVV